MSQKPVKKKNPRTSVPEKKRKASKWTFYTVLIVFAFILYGNTIPNEYSLDDNLVIQNNEYVMKGISAISEIFSSHYRALDRNEYGYRPVAKATFAVESEFFNQNPHVSHFVNVLLYALLLVLLFILLNRIFPEIPGNLKLIIVMLFAAHPVHTEVVASLKNREELLCFLFAAVASLCFINAYHTNTRRIFNAVLGVANIVLSILSKQTGLIFCLIIPLIFLQFYFRPLNLDKMILSENRKFLYRYIVPVIISVCIGVVCLMSGIVKNAVIWFFLVILPLTIIFLYIRKLYFIDEKAAEFKISFRKYIYLVLFSAAVIIIGYLIYIIPEIALPSENKPMFGYESPLFDDYVMYNKISLGFMGLWYYLKLIFIPYPLSFYYGYNMIPVTGLADFRVILSFLLYLTLITIAIIYFYKNKIISFGIIIYLAGLALFTNWYKPIPGIIGERMLFISSFGFCMVIGGVMLMIRNNLLKKGKFSHSKLPRTVYILTSLIILIYSVQTIARNRDWENHITLYKADIVHLENSAKANSMYAEELMCYVNENIRKNKHVDKSIVKLALKHYMKSTEVYPGYSSSYNNIGTIYIIFFNDYLSAVPYFEKAFSFDSLNSECIYNLAYAYEKSGDTLKALKYYEKAVRKDSLNINMISGWANLLNNIGDMNRAIDLNMHIIKIKPSSDLPYINIGNYYIALKDTANAVKYWEKAIAITPVNDNLNTFLASYFMKEGDNKKYMLYSSKIGMKKKGID